MSRSFYVQVGDNCSPIYDSDIGTIQGSVLGPILYAIFVSPLFDLTQLTNFVDDNFCIEWVLYQESHTVAWNVHMNSVQFYNIKYQWHC